ncbi:MAG: RNA-protein complex protein Nop10 [Thermocladium sp.]|jgi:H/ACA ribonucleoprotein complex subunit 3|nr:MAG: ribosome biogenesis protein [Thermocladium sp. ECH_B]
MVNSILRRCRNCGKYTLRKDRCPYCGGELKVPHPPKFSPEDKYRKYKLVMDVLSGRIQVSEETMKRIKESIH